MISVKRMIRRYCRQWMASHPEEMVQSLRQHHGPERVNLETLDPATIPESIEGFHDLAYLFVSHQANRGVIAQDFDEAAYLWKVITTNKPGILLEIGRWLGGSTILQAAAASTYNGKLISVDLKVQMPLYADDRLIQEHLRKVGLNNVTMRIADSRSFNPGSAVQYAFIDGDHSYEGVKADYENVMRYIEPGGDVLFHDACATRSFATRHEPVARFIKELRERKNLRFVKEVGSIVHFNVMTPLHCL